MKKFKIFIACDTTSLAKVRRIIKSRKQTKLKLAINLA